MNRRTVVAGVAGALALAGTGIGLAVSQTGPSCPTAAQLAGGGTYNATGCTIDMGVGVTVKSPLTLTGGKLTATTQSGSKPILRIQSTTASITNTTIQGTNTTGHIVFSAGQAGIELFGTTNVNITNTNISRTGGDCLEVFTYPPSHFPPNTNLSVTGGTYDQCGRDGISPSDVTNSRFSNIDIKRVGQSGIDAESDFNGVGMGNIDFQSVNIENRGVVITELLTGPVNFTGGSITGRFLWTSARPQAFPISVTGGTFVCAFVGSKPAIIVQKNPTVLSFINENFTRPNGGQAPLWSVTNGASLALTHSQLSPPLGNNDSTSTVTITP